MLPRACQCVPKQGTDAAGACTGRTEKISVILMSCTKKLSSLSFPPSHSTGLDITVQAEEEGQAVLDCLQPWHRLLMERPMYHFSWAPGIPGTKMVFLTLVDLKLCNKPQQEHCAEHFNGTIRTTDLLRCFLAVLNVSAVLNLCTDK